MIGVPRNKVILNEYDEQWKKDFEDEKLRLLSVCGDKIITIEHVGSTSVPGLISKPLIDIALTFENKEKEEKLVEKFVSLNYEFIEDAGVEDRLFFVKRINGNSYYHIHAYYKGSLNYENQVMFRDYLRNNKEAFEEYAQLKRDLYENYKENRVEYTMGKTSFIQRILSEKFQLNN